MAAPVAAQLPLAFDDATGMSFSEAARRLAISKAQLCQMILDGELTQIRRGYVDRLQIEAIAERLPKHKDRRRRDPNRLPRTTEDALWLLADWGGTGGVNDLAAAMEVSWQTADGLIQNAVSSGFAERVAKSYCVTDEGWSYVTKHRSALG